jgi:outer membrane receptor protein involved in Fe transport
LNNWGYYWPNHRWIEEPRIFDRGSNGPTRSYTRGGYPANLTNRRRWHENIVLSHFFDGLGGSHHLKSGYVLQWEDNREGAKGYPGHVRYIFENGLPNRIDVQNTPVQWSQHALLQNSAYVTDRWQVGKRLTMNVGVRFDRYTSYLPEQVRESANANPFNLANDVPGLETFGNQTFPKRTVAKFNNPVPRLSLIYDLFGNGKTAIKASYGRFSINPADTLADDLQINEVRTATYTWNGTMPFTPDYLRSCLKDTSCSVLSQPSLAQNRSKPAKRLYRRVYGRFGPAAFRRLESAFQLCPKD